MARASVLTPEERARRRARYLTDLLRHTGAFIIIINAFFWILDIAGGGDLNWAFWVTGAWGFALAFHALADALGLEERKARQYLEEDRGENPGAAVRPDPRCPGRSTSASNEIGGAQAHDLVGDRGHARLLRVHGRHSRPARVVARIDGLPAKHRRAGAHPRSG